MKCCTKCKRTTDDFSQDSRHKDGLQSWCRPCSNKSGLSWRAKNIVLVRLKDRARSGSCNAKVAKAEYDRIYRKKPKSILSDRMKRYRKFWPELTHEQAFEKYMELFMAQKECCAICGRHQSQARKILGIDHCHKTGKVRGLLCDHCNRGIGLLRDCPKILTKAMEYLNG